MAQPRFLPRCSSSSTRTRAASFPVSRLPAPRVPPPLRAHRRQSITRSACAAAASIRRTRTHPHPLEPPASFEGSSIQSTDLPRHRATLAREGEQGADQPEAMPLGPDRRDRWEVGWRARARSGAHQEGLDAVVPHDPEQSGAAAACAQLASRHGGRVGPRPAQPGRSFPFPVEVVWRGRGAAQSLTPPASSAASGLSP